MKAWTREEIEWLSQHHRKHDVADLAQMLGCSPKAVYNKLYDIGMNREQPPKYPAELVSAVAADYAHKPRPQIARERGITYNQVTWMLKRAGVYANNKNRGARND